MCIRDRIYTELYHIGGDYFANLKLFYRNRFFEFANYKEELSHGESFVFSMIVTVFDGQYYRVYNKSYWFEVRG